MGAWARAMHQVAALVEDAWTAKGSSSEGNRSLMAATSDIFSIVWSPAASPVSDPARPAAIAPRSWLKGEERGSACRSSGERSSLSRTRTSAMEADVSSFRSAVQRPRIACALTCASPFASSESPVTNV
eukprot:6396555-Prymnesium_polylepis.1